MRKTYQCKIRNLLFAITVLLFSPFLVAQEGHPLDGTWSGDRIVNGEKVRMLLVMRLQPDQSIESTLIEGGVRIPVHSIVLEPANWSISMVVDGRSRNGDPVRYNMRGYIENLGSAKDRTIVGKWDNGTISGDFNLEIN